MNRIVLLIAALLLSGAALAADAWRAEYICDAVSRPDERTQCIERAAAVTDDGSRSAREGFSWLSMIWPLGWYFVYYAFGLLIGRYIHRDARHRDWVFLGVRPVWWAAVAVFEPAMGLLVYWAAHYSKFAQSYQEATAAPSSASGA